MLLNIALNISGVFFLGLTAFLLLKAPKQVWRSGIAVTCALLSLTFGNLNSIDTVSYKDFKDFELKTRQLQTVIDDATATVAQLHQLAAMTAALQVDMIAGGDRFGGTDTARHKDAQKETLLAKLKTLGLTDGELAEIDQADRRWVMWDYAIGILMPLNTASDKAKAEAYTKAFYGPDAPTPDQCEALLKQFQINDDKTKELLEDYKYYMLNNKHRRPEVWHDRLNWQ